MRWRRSSRSGTTGNCVELRQDLAAVRDSKQPRTPLPIPASATRHLLAFAKSG